MVSQKDGCLRLPVRILLTIEMPVICAVGRETKDDMMTQRAVLPKREHEMHVCSARHNGNAALSAQRPYAWEQVQTAMTETCGQSCREFAERLLLLPSLIDSFKALLLQPGILSYI